MTSQSCSQSGRRENFEQLVTDMGEQLTHHRLACIVDVGTVPEAESVAESEQDGGWLVVCASHEDAPVW